MAALRDQWQADRQKRQQAVAQRRQTVAAELEALQQGRQQTAIALRQDLVEQYEALQAETTLYLAQIAQQRQVQARRTAAALKAFDAELRETVADLRAQNRAQMEQVQQSVAELQAITQETLAGHTRDRAVMRSRQAEELAQYVDDLEASVAEYLSTMTEKRQMAAVVDRAQRHRDREALTQEVDALRDEFAIYRQQMQIFRENLRQSVWGETATEPMPPETPPAAQTAAVPPKKTASSKVQKPVALARPLAPDPAEPKAAPPSHPAPSPVQADPSTEESVYDYLQSHSAGARLTEIESTLGINRFQAVDALRSLIQKELIVQKDRTYHIQEEAVL